METTYITTTAEIWGHSERIEHLNKFPDYIKKNIVEIKSSAGTHRYIWQDGQWKPIVK